MKLLFFTIRRFSFSFKTRKKFFVIQNTSFKLFMIAYFKETQARDNDAT